VGMLQQNCFEDTCRTGVLKGGKVEDMGADMDCYKEFCKSPEGIRSNACNTGQVTIHCGIHLHIHIHLHLQATPTCSMDSRHQPHSL